MERSIRPRAECDRRQRRVRAIHWSRRSAPRARGKADRAVSSVDRHVPIRAASRNHGKEGHAPRSPGLSRRGQCNEQTHADRGCDSSPCRHDAHTLLSEITPVGRRSAGPLLLAQQLRRELPHPPARQHARDGCARLSTAGARRPDYVPRVRGNSHGTPAPLPAVSVWRRTCRSTPGSRHWSHTSTA